MIEIIYRECYVFFVYHNEIDFVPRNDIKRHKATLSVWEKASKCAISERERPPWRRDTPLPCWLPPCWWWTPNCRSAPAMPTRRARKNGMQRYHYFHLMQCIALKIKRRKPCSVPGALSVPWISGISFIVLLCRHLSLVLWSSYCGDAVLESSFDFQEWKFDFYKWKLNSYKWKLDSKTALLQM